LLSNSGTWVQNLTVPYVVFQLTHSSTWVGIAAFSQLAPMAMMSPLGGTIADRLDRRRVLLVTQVAMGVVAIMMGGAWVTGVASVPVIIGLVAVGGVITGINAPAWQAFVSELVPRDALLNAVTLNSAQFNAARAFGPALGGLVLVTLGPGPAFFINAASYGAVLVALALIATPKRPPVSTPRPRILSDARATIGYVQDRRGMLACYVAVVALGLFGQPIFSLVIVFAEEVFQVGGLRYGLLSAALGIGSVIAAPVVAGPGYSDAFKAEAVKMVIDGSRPIATVANELDINPGTLGVWVNKYRDAHPIEEDPLTPAERIQFRELQAENRELRMKNEFLGKAASFFAQEYR
jgi:MFS family permease